MKVLIIGSRGFIGSHLTSHLREVGHEVTECDVHSEYGDTHYIQVSVVDAQFDHVFTSRGYDVCVNCSGAASVADSFKHPTRDFQLNLSNVQRMLVALSLYQPQCKFINLSSAAVYGNPVSLPLKEEMAHNPISPYGFHKKLSEAILDQFAKLHGTQTMSLRIFSAYGNGLKKQILWDLHQKMKSSKEIELFGTGSETRDFVHVLDVARVISLIIAQDDFQSKVINVASGQETTIRDLSTNFAHAMGWKGKIHFSNSERAGDPDNWRADISKLTILGYSPKITLESGLKMYAKWAKEKY
jgi:UDP-glucose 4-epimerase